MLGAAQEAEGPKPLVRKDLLVLRTGEIDPPLRDIFRPKPAAAAGRPARPSVRPGPSAPEPEPAPTFTLNLSYVGSIKSGGRIIALVLRGGQTFSVSEGDEIVPGYRVLRVTAEAVVVRGPTGETRTFAKQGDRP
jgi:Tfp pilus assembly protein PilP